MKRFIKWLADLFNVGLTREVIKEVEKIEYRYLPVNGKITGDIVIEGDVRDGGTIHVVDNDGKLDMTFENAAEETE